MPPKARELSAVEVNRLTHHGGSGNLMTAVGGVPGLYLQITPEGARSWVLRILIGSKRRDMGLGPADEVSLKQAREKAREAREQVRQGVDPIADRLDRRAAMTARLSRMTFEGAFKAYAEDKLSELATDRDRARWKSSVERFAVPQIGSKPIDDLTIHDILRVLKPIWTEKAETARKLRARVEAIISWAIVHGHRKSDDNPARLRGNLDQILPKHSAVAKTVNQPAISIADAPLWFAALRKRNGTSSAALQFLALTAVRSGNVRHVEWSEVDEGAKVWSIPADKMKTARPHTVPLSGEAMKIIQAQPMLDDSPYVFAGGRGRPLSDMSLSAVMRKLHAAELDADRKGWVDKNSGRPAVAHGLRSTFRDWAAETGVDRDIAEIALAHSVGSAVERAYRRTDLRELRRAVMSDWETFLMGG